ncbi:MAG: hypothetical protein DRJ42_14860 [Deltaproteobacteria bacterium]|nr:MAG: hypothetical protein DRJ42_14860 [Deltaproteobacteria bacterium]
MDSGMGPADTGTGGDGGTDSGTPPTDSGGGTCPPIVLPAPTTPACAAETQACGAAATSQAAFEACLDDDPMAMACTACVGQGQVSCLTMNGCDAEWGNLECCGEATGCTDVACLNSMCPTEVGAFNTCATSVGATCAIQGAVLTACTIPAG